MTSRTQRLALKLWPLTLLVMLVVAPWLVIKAIKENR